MKTFHKIILIALLLISCFSAFSLAQINQINKIDFFWYNNKEFINYPRTSLSNWNKSSYPEYMDFEIIDNPKSMVIVNGESTIRSIDIPKFNPKDEFLIFASLGEVKKEGFNIRIQQIAQRGNIIELMVGFSEPANSKDAIETSDFPYDLVKINKNMLSNTGDILFIFKSLDGGEIYKENYKISKL